MYIKKAFIPGEEKDNIREERDNIMIKRQVIKLGGLIVILLITKHSLEDK